MALNDTITYDPRNVEIIFGEVGLDANAIPQIDTEEVSGFGEGDFLTISFPEDQFNFRTGADGKEVASCNAAANTAQISLSAIPGCPLYSQLFARTFVQGNNRSKAQPFSIWIFPNGIDPSGSNVNEYYYSACALVVSRPDISLGTDLGDRTFTIRAPNLQIRQLD